MSQGETIPRSGPSKGTTSGAQCWSSAGYVRRDNARGMAVCLPDRLVSWATRRWRRDELWRFRSRRGDAQRSAAFHTTLDGRTMSQRVPKQFPTLPALPQRQRHNRSGRTRDGYGRCMARLSHCAPVTDVRTSHSDLIARAQRNTHVYRPLTTRCQAARVPYAGYCRPALPGRINIRIILQPIQRCRS